MRWVFGVMLATLAATVTVNVLLLGYGGTSNDPVGRLSPVAYLPLPVRAQAHGHARVDDAHTRLPTTSSLAEVLADRGQPGAGGLQRRERDRAAGDQGEPDQAAPQQMTARPPAARPVGEGEPAKLRQMGGE